MSSPSNNESPIKQYLLSTNEPKSLHGVQISVEDRQCLNVLGTANPDILPTTFHDEETHQVLSVQHHDDQSTFGERTPTPSPPLTPKSKGKAKEEELELDSRAEDIYKEEKTPGLSQPKQIIATSPKQQGKEQDNLAISTAGSSNIVAPKPELKGQALRLATMEEALRHICHGSHHASSSANVITTHSTEKQPTGHTTLTPISEQPSTMAADPAKDHITLDYERFRSHTAGDNNIGQLVRQAVDNAYLYRGFLLHQVYRKVQDEFEPSFEKRLT